MKKLFLALATLAAFVSCSKDDATQATAASDEIVVTFDVSSPELATRYGEGKEATVLEWFVYEGEATSGPNLVRGLCSSMSNFSGKADVTLKLIQGRTYNVLFWAHAPGVSNSDLGGFGSANAVYNIDSKAVTMSVNYDKLSANEESYDAFYKFHRVGTVTSLTKGGKVELKRPFAQLNIATSDTADAQKADLDVKYTGIGVAKAYTKLNFIDGSVSEPQTITFNVAEKATGTFQYNSVDYDIISMNYLLVNEQELVDVKLKLQEENSANAEILDRAYIKISVQRNHRTYILGDIYTQPATFNVVINDVFDGNHYEDER